LSLRQLGLVAVCELKYYLVLSPGSRTCRPDRYGLSCRCGGAVVPGYRSDGGMVGARLTHNRVGYSSPSTTMGDIALALDIVAITARLGLWPSQWGSTQGSGLFLRL
jgi:hypothetical protein